MKRKLTSFDVGKWVPTIARKIDSENPTADLKINLKGVGIGDGFMSPPDSAIYGDELYQGHSMHYWLYVTNVLQFIFF